MRSHDLSPKGRPLTAVGVILAIIWRDIKSTILYFLACTVAATLLVGPGYMGATRSAYWYFVYLLYLVMIYVASIIARWPDDD